MARTMKWPPVPVAGRIPMVEGVAASTVLIIQTLSDLQTQPFNSPLLSLGNITFKQSNTVRARINNTLKRLVRIIEVQGVIERRSIDDSDNEYVVQFVDRETRTKSEVTV